MQGWPSGYGFEMNIYELIGIIIGDGYVRYRPDQRVYQIEIAGNTETDKPYFNLISQFIFKETGRKASIREKVEKKGKSLRLEINNKKFIEKLIKLGLPVGKKTFTISIPPGLTDWKYSRCILRGIFETDGCIYFSKSKKCKYPTYPRIEIKTSSKKLLSQIIKILKQKNFKVQVRKPLLSNTFAIYLNGPKMLEKWIKEVGISSIKNLSKYSFWKKKGFYIPKITLKSRLKSCRDGPAATAVDF